MEDLRLSPLTAPAAHRAGRDSEEQLENPAAQNLQTAAEGLKEPQAARRRDVDLAWVPPSGASVPPPAPPCLRLQTTTTLRPPHRQGAAVSRRGRTCSRPPSRQDVGHVVLGVAQLRGSRDTSQPEEQRGGGRGRRRRSSTSWIWSTRFSARSTVTSLRDSLSAATPAWYACTTCGFTEVSPTCGDIGGGGGPTSVEDV